MGGELPPAPPGARPSFAVRAARDAGGAGTPLQRIQIIKGWVEDGRTREAVHEVAGYAPGQASVDPETCEPSGVGYDALCAVWVDPDFDPGQHAFYYARVLENPSCRWSTWACHRLAVDCREPDGVDGELFDACCGDDVPRTVQERAWGSPIWYTPAGAVAH
jgi:hypothetical protein